jgi:hypothetical protein
MKLFDHFTRLCWRLQHPVSMPEEVALALGIQASNDLAFDEFISLLIHPGCHPKNLKKFMPREQAEATFALALRRERFSQHSLFSYYFGGGWLAFSLEFDRESRLRRVYIRHKELVGEEGVEIALYTPTVEQIEMKA